MENTSVRLKRLMKERGLKQIDILNLAAPYCKQFKVKLNKSDLSQYINGKFAPGQWKLTILGLALNVSEAWLMGYDVPRERSPESFPSLPPHSVPEREQLSNIVKLAGRDGRYLERRLSDAQLNALMAMVEQLPDAEDL